MKTKINLLWTLLFLLGFGACEDPSEMVPSDGLNVREIYATFVGSDVAFYPEADFPYGEEIKIVVPYYWPEDGDVKADVTRMRLYANLPNNVTILPKLSCGDLSQAYPITITYSDGTQTHHKLIAELRRSNKKEVLKFKLPAPADLEGVVSKEGDENVIYIPVGPAYDLNKLKDLKPEMQVSPHATVTPSLDEPQDFGQEIIYTVKADDGSSTTYTVKHKLEYEDYGIGYTRLMWQLSRASLGFTAEHNESGIAAWGDYMVINDKTSPIRCYNKVTGAFVKTLDMTGFDGNMCLQVFTDSKGRLFATNYAGQWGGTSLKFFTWDNIDAPAEKFYEMSSISTSLQYGRKVSMVGDFDDHAYIYVTVSNSKTILRYEIKNGQVLDGQPVTTQFGGSHNWNALCKIAPVSEATPDEFYMMDAGYSEVGYVIDGQWTTDLEAMKTNFSSYGYPIDICYVEFNNAKYLYVLMSNWGWSYWGLLYDVTSRPTLTRVWKGVTYIPGDVTNPNSTGGITCEVSEDGKSMFMYMMGTNNGVIKYELTSIKI